MLNFVESHHHEWGTSRKDTKCKGSKYLDVLPRLAALLAVLGGGGGVCRAVPGGDGGGGHRHRQQRAGGHRQHVQPPRHRGRVQTTA